MRSHRPPAHHPLNASPPPSAQLAAAWSPIGPLAMVRDRHLSYVLLALVGMPSLTSHLRNAQRAKRSGHHVVRVRPRQASRREEFELGEDMEKAFWEAAGESGEVGCDEFVKLCQGILQIDLSRVELERIFYLVVRGEGEAKWRPCRSTEGVGSAAEKFGDGSGRGECGLSWERFRQTVSHRFFLRGLRRAHLKGDVGGSVPFPAGYDLDLETAANYHREGEGFYGPFAQIRATRDHDYHGRYSRERQQWQDDVLDTVVQRTVEQPTPWLVFTCGAMGVGKGYALGWMSSEGIFPLENIVHIDPDHFKHIMPEWSAYVEHGKKLMDPTIPGSRCHKESTYLQEIALEESLSRSQNIWMDGSLRNAEWFVHVFDDIRERFPAYRIAIFQVTAPESLVLQRVAQRAARTGRAIPEALVKESLDAVERSVIVLAPRADYLVCIDNTEEIPRLVHSASFDRSGEWPRIQRRFARTFSSPEEFPTSLSPFFVTPLPSATLVLAEELKHVQDGVHEGQDATLHIGSVRSRCTISPAAWVSLDGEGRNLARVPEGTASFVWIYPGELESSTEGLPELSEAEVSLLTIGGFAHFDVEERLLSINAVSMKRPDTSEGRPALVQLGVAMAVSEREALALPSSRWAKVTAAHMRARGARRYAFVTPQEKLVDRRLSTSSGFLYEMAGEVPGEQGPSEGTSVGLGDGGCNMSYIFFPIENRFSTEG